MEMKDKLTDKLRVGIWNMEASALAMSHGERFLNFRILGQLLWSVLSAYACIFHHKAIIPS